MNALRLFRVWLLSLAFVACASFVFAPPAFAQEDLADVPVEDLVESDVPVQAVAGEDRNVAIDRKVLFDASSSAVPIDADARYLW